MKRSVDEKVSYNKAHGGDFGWGYVFGVTLYRKYGKDTRAAQETTRLTIDGMKQKAREGSESAKGFMCGVRDAANERKAKKRETQ